MCFGSVVSVERRNGHVTPIEDELLVRAFVIIGRESFVQGKGSPFPSRWIDRVSAHELAKAPTATDVKVAQLFVIREGHRIEGQA